MMSYEEYVKMQNEYEEKNINKETVNEEELKVTNVKVLNGYAKGHIVKLPSFAENEPFVAKVRRPSLLALTKSGKIPNSLLSTASELFNGSLDNDNENVLSDIYDICYIMADAALVEPTLKEIEEAGLELTDEQLMAIFNYTQTGVKALENFR